MYIVYSISIHVNYIVYSSRIDVNCIVYSIHVSFIVCIVVVYV